MGWAMPERVPAINKAQRIAQEMLTRIVDGDLHPGSMFGTEAELLRQFKVSRPTLREALRTLEWQGVLSLRPGPRGGIAVARPTIDRLASTLSVYLWLNDVPLVEILRARMAIEPMLVRDAAVNGTDAQFDEMDQSIERLERAADDDSVAIYRENRMFHSLIARASGNAVLDMFWLAIRDVASGEGEKFHFTEGNRLHIVAAHREIVAACRRRDPALAERRMVAHLAALDALLKRLGGRGRNDAARAEAPAQPTARRGAPRDEAGPRRPVPPAAPPARRAARRRSPR